MVHMPRWNGNAAARDPQMDKVSMWEGIYQNGRFALAYVGGLVYLWVIFTGLYWGVPRRIEQMALQLLS